MSGIQHNGGGAQALPLARAFLATGGRLSVSPRGVLEPVADLGRIFGPDSAAREARRAFVIARRFSRRLRNPRFAANVKALVLQNGQPGENGWLTMEAAQ